MADAKTQRIIDEVNKLFADRSVPPAKTAERMEEIIEVAQANIDALADADSDEND